MRELANAGPGPAKSDPVRAVHVVHSDQPGIARVHHVNPAGSIDADARRAVELSDIRTIGAEAGPVGSVHIVDADDAGIVRIGNVDSAGGIHRDAVGAVKLPDIAALCSVRDQVAAVQVIGAEYLAGVREIERRVRGVVAGCPRDDDSVCPVELGAGTVDRLRRSIHCQRAAEGPLEGKGAGHMTASASAGAPFHSRAARKAGVDRRRPVGR